MEGITIIRKSDIFGIDRSIMHDSGFITVHLTTGIPVKIPLDRIVWNIVPDDDLAEHYDDMDLLTISIEIGKDMQIIYAIDGAEKNVLDLAEAIGISVTIFQKKKKES
jgi:hypothetical protein